MTTILQLTGLQVGFRTRGQTSSVLRGIDLQIEQGQAYGLVGESGCGKSTVALAILRALPRNGWVTAGSVSVAGQDVARLDRAGLRHMRARTVSMVYQDAGRALNPTLTIGRQLIECFTILGLNAASAQTAAHAMLERVRIAGPQRVMAAYPHQLSGGMQQRVVIAMALAKEPSLLILDEPTTGLDATVEADILDLLSTLREELGTTLLFISHNLGVTRQMCGRVGVLYAGKLVEEGPADAVLSQPIHPYTVRLLRCLPVAGRSKGQVRLDTIAGTLPPPGPLPPGCIFAPRCDLADDRCRSLAPPTAGQPPHTALCFYPDRALPPSSPPPPTLALDKQARPALRAIGITKTFGDGVTRVRAVEGVSLTVPAGQTLGLVGESGSGKTTLARLLIGLIAPDPGGTVELDGVAVAPLAKARPDAARQALQIVFQNPDSALNRAHTIRHILTRAAAGPARLAWLLDAVRLTERVLPMRPRELSGGLKQRVAIARAFAGTPRAVICDEPTSALDVSVQASVLNLLADLQAREAVSYVFISHDLGVVRYISDRIAVLYLGRVLEEGPAEAVFAGPHHPYTEALLSAVPGGTGPRVRLAGEMPSASAPPSGCVFNPRCPRKLGAVCETQVPPADDQEGHVIRCHIPRPLLHRAEG